MGRERDLPEIGSQVNFEHVKESEFADRVAQSDSPKKNTDIRDDDLHSLLR